MHAGLGHPGSGQTSTELLHEGGHGRERQAFGSDAKRSGFQSGALEPEDERGEGRTPVTARGEAGLRAREGMMSAEDREPAGAEDVADELTKRGGRPH